MIIEDNSEFFVAEDKEFGLRFGPKGAWRPEFEEFIMKRGIKVVILNYASGWRGGDISFLVKMPFLEGLIIRNWSIEDLSSVLELKNLKLLLLECSVKEIFDLSLLNSIDSIYLSWSSKIIGLDRCVGVKKLYIDGYPYADLRYLSNINKLNDLTIISKKIENLFGLEDLKYLRRIFSANCTHLRDISSLVYCKKLEVLELENCKNLKEIPAGLDLRELKAVVLKNTGNILSLRPLLSCKSLNSIEFIEETNILDGDIKALLELPKIKRVWFKNRKHYNINRDDINRKISPV